MLIENMRIIYLSCHNLAITCHLIYYILRHFLLIDKCSYRCADADFSHDLLMQTLLTMIPIWNGNHIVSCILYTFLTNRVKVHPAKQGCRLDLDDDMDFQSFSQST